MAHESGGKRGTGDPSPVDRSRARTRDSDSGAAPSARGVRVPRKTFLDWILRSGAGGLTLSVAYPVVRFIIPPKAVEASVTSTTVPVDPKTMPKNSGMIFKFGKKPGILIRTPQGEYRAFSAICTHLGCTVQYREDLRHIWCACHNGHYDLEGKNIAGPPPRPLARYDAIVRSTDFVVARKP